MPVFETHKKEGQDAAFPVTGKDECSEVLPYLYYLSHSQKLHRIKLEPHLSLATAVLHEYLALKEAGTMNV